ncbi:MAG: hypothetical protein K5872_10345 [Rhizobiaceae bacterium]|nr:hypothetical protein [Rhizobiaceae bacterium]MCV0406615.1 hypothetical protein [Rhizobiaceae bacterium]
MALQLRLKGREHSIEIVARRPELVLRIDGVEHRVAVMPGAVMLDGRAYLFDEGVTGDRHFVRIDGRTFDLEAVDPDLEEEAAAGGLDVIRAPMPGAVVSLAKAEGDQVRRGETVLTIESMKLQTALTAPRDGVIERIVRQEGQTFDKDEAVVLLVPLEEDAREQTS